jgi:hypothetical protein
MAVDAMCHFPADSEHSAAALSLAGALLRHGAAPFHNMIALVRARMPAAAAAAFERLVRTYDGTSRWGGAG